MMRIKLSFLLLMVISFSACINKSNESGDAQKNIDKSEQDTSDQTPDRMALQDSITQMEKDLHSTLELDEAKANQMLVEYLNYVNYFEHDSLAPEYLFRAAEIAMNTDRPSDAVAYLNRIDKNYPEFDKKPQVIYLLGYIYDSMLNKKEAAEKHYKEFLKKYPEHRRSEEVKLQLKYLNKSDLEMVREFEKNNAG
ncbi:MAG: tetratricopeptide repeat protein [Bacteroidales bacterium]